MGRALGVTKSRAGFAHGFCVLSEIADFSYKCTEYYASQDEGTIIWNDPDIGIKWPMDSIKLSPKDSKAPLLVNIAAHQLQPSRGEG